MVPLTLILGGKGEEESRVESSQAGARAARTEPVMPNDAERRRGRGALSLLLTSQPRGTRRIRQFRRPDCPDRRTLTKVRQTADTTPTTCRCPDYTAWDGGRKAMFTQSSDRNAELSRRIRRIGVGGLELAYWSWRIPCDPGNGRWRQLVDWSVDRSVLTTWAECAQTAVVLAKIAGLSTDHPRKEFCFSTRHDSDLSCKLGWCRGEAPISPAILVESKKIPAPRRRQAPGNFGLTQRCGPVLLLRAGVKRPSSLQPHPRGAAVAPC